MCAKRKMGGGAFITTVLDRHRLGRGRHGLLVQRATTDTEQVGLHAQWQGIICLFYRTSVPNSGSLTVQVLGCTSTSHSSEFAGGTCPFRQCYWPFFLPRPLTDATSRSRFMRAMKSSGISFGQTAEHSPMLVQPPKPSASIWFTMWTTRS